MRLSDDDINYALCCVNEVISLRGQAGIPVPERMRLLGRRFDITMLTSGMSPRGHQISGRTPQLDPEELTPSTLVGTQEAADIIGVSRRHVRRLATRLEGENHGGRLFFNRTTVTEYAQERQHGR